MSQPDASLKILRLASLLLCALAASCGGGGGSNDDSTSGGGNPQDTVAPTVVTVGPGGGSTEVPTNALLTVTFSEPMDPLTVTVVNFTLTGDAGAPIAFSVVYTDFGNLATLTPTAGLPPDTEVTATVGTGVTDEAGNPLFVPFSWSFTTAAPPDTTPPTVSSVFPAAGDTGVAINTTVAASFSEAMDPLSISGNFTLSDSGGASIAGSAVYAASGNTATFTPSSDLPPNTLITATITTGVTDAVGNPLAADFAWTFTTGDAQDTTHPAVISTAPASGDANVAVNALVTVTFNEAMNPPSLGSFSFTLLGPSSTLVTGTVSYSVNGHLAAFTPLDDLIPGSSYTAKLTTAVTDAAGNGLDQIFSWSFTTGSASDVTAPSVLFVSPGDGTSGICTNKSVGVTFDEPMDPQTITTATFLLSETAGAAVAGLVSYDAASNIATFDPSADLTGTPDTSYTVTIVGGEAGVKDAAGNMLLIDKLSTFTTNATTCTNPPPLGAVGPFGAMGGSSALTNAGLDTVINGDAGANAPDTSTTGLHDGGGNLYTTTPDNDGAVNGLVYTQTAPPGSVPGATITQAQADAQTAFDSLSPAFLPGGIDMSSLLQCPTCGGLGGGVDQLGGRTLPPGVYLSATGVYDLSGPGQPELSLTLDAGGDPSAVWVFQTATGTGTLNVGLAGPSTPATPIQVLLVNGAQAANVFWYVPGGATIGTGSTMVGTLLANGLISISTPGGSPPTAVPTTLNGRAISLTGGVSITNTIVNVPSP